MKLLCLLLSALVASIPAWGGPPVSTPIEQAASSAEAPGFVRQQAVAGSARSGKAFTKKQKQVTKEKNAQKNDGTTRCENCDTETVPGTKHEKGVTPPLNETQVDHKIPKSKGGPGEEDNAQVLCRDCNLKKGDKDPTPEEAQ
jgi:5-methylcytosine-specific restriction endonuclease McrA